MKLIEEIAQGQDVGKIEKEVRRLPARMLTPGIAPATINRLLDEKRNLKFKVVELVRKGAVDLVHVWADAFKEELNTDSAKDILNRRK